MKFKAIKYLVALTVIGCLVGTTGLRAIDAGTGLKKIVLIAGTKSHGPGDHEYEKGLKLLKHCLDTSPNVKGVKTEVYLNGWPKDSAVLEDADTVLLFSDGSDHDEKAHPLLLGDRLATIDRLMKRGVGFMAIHYAVFIPSKKGGDQYLDWMGGYFDYENGTAANKWFSKIETKEYTVRPATPTHPIVRGVKPFGMKEEYYFNMRFREPDARRVPILTFGSDDHDSTSVVAWAVQRAEGGRGFGYTGGHFHKNWLNENARRMVLNALLWTAKVEVPPGGVESTMPADERSQSVESIKALIITGRHHPAHNWRERVEITKVKHPITDGLTAFDTVDELYFHQQGELPAEALVAARSKTTGQDEPLAFAYDYGQGRVFQTLLGHDAEAIRKAGELIRRGSAWAAGQAPAVQRTAAAAQTAETPPLDSAPTRANELRFFPIQYSRMKSL